MYIMLTNYNRITQTGLPMWYQIGYRQDPNDCIRWFMQYRREDPSKPTVTDQSQGCVTANTWYMLRIRYSPGGPWASIVKTEDGCCYVWQAPNDPGTLDFPPQDGEYSSEVLNRHDQSGGSWAQSGRLDDVYWLDASYNAIEAEWQGDTFCQLCGSGWPSPSGPYNVIYPAPDAIRVWTDGY